MEQELIICTTNHIHIRLQYIYILIIYQGMKTLLYVIETTSIISNANLNNKLYTIVFLFTLHSTDSSSCGSHDNT